MWPVADVDPAWMVFVAVIDGDVSVAYDDYEWVSIGEAHRRCTELVSASLELVA
jgi:hypothetical protein